ncbi:MAG: aldo/keto reductase [Lachnospiraceae bacterium]|nr:aldo/keto reductase [Lachnospiraceae bacterium]
MNREISKKLIPPCVIGTWGYGSGYNGAKMVFGKSYSEEQLWDTFETAYELGFTMWDTAEVYGMGNAEKLLGKMITDKKEIILSTKHMPGKKYRSGEVTKALKNSLERLNVERIDLYWLHEPYNLQKNLEEMANCVKSGMVKQIGISNCDIEQLEKADHILKQCGVKLSAVQNHFSLLSMERQKEVLRYCKEQDIRFYGYMILEQGALSGHYDSSNPFPFFSMRGFLFGKNKFRKIQPLLDYERKLAEKYQVDSAQIPIAWARMKGVIPIVGVTKRKYAEQLAEGMKIQMTEDEMEKLEQLAVDTGVCCKGGWETV